MASSSSEQSSDYSASSGMESTTSHMFSLPSDSSDVQTEITPPSSPATIGRERKPMTPRNILEASHRLAQLSLSPSQTEITPTKSKQRNHRRSYFHASPFVNDETGYEADGDEVASTPTSEITTSTHRPKFPRIDTRLRRRVASLLANRPLSGDPNLNEISSTSHRDASVSQTLTNLKKTLVKESHELQLRTKGEPIGLGLGLGLGLPRDHPLRSRAFTMPAISPTSEQGLEPLEWLPSLMSSPALALETIADPRIPVAFQPTLPVSSPIDHLPPSLVCYGEPVELTPSHLATLTYTPEYSSSASHAQTSGAMEGMSVASWF